MYTEFSDLLGKTIVKIDGIEGDDSVTFYTKCGKVYELLHEQECGECVRLYDTAGDLQRLLNSPITMAEEVISDVNPDSEYQDSFTWTFYKLGTVIDTITMRWLGESNGYYSETVDFKLVKDNNPNMPDKVDTSTPMVGDTGGTKLGEYHRTCEHLVDLSKKQGIYFAIDFIVAAGYTIEDLHTILPILQNTKGANKLL